MAIDQDSVLRTLLAERIRQAPVSEANRVWSRKAIDMRQGRLLRSGFTLVELLVVIGMIALLIALLLPALAAARREAQLLKCEAQLRTLGQLMVMHSLDHKGYFPMAGHIYPAATTATPEMIDSPVNCGDAAMQKFDYYCDSGTGTDREVAPMPEALASYLSVTPVSYGWSNVMTQMVQPGPMRDAFMCPADEYSIERPPVETAVGDPVWIQNLGTAMYAWTSYGFNEEFFGWYPKAWIPLHGRIAACPYPTETMLMMDILDGPGNAHIYSNIPNSSLADVYNGTDFVGNYSEGSGAFDLVRHHGLVNILYADGHVESQPILNNGATAPAPGVSAGSPGNMPSGYTSPGQMGGGGLGGVSVARGLQ